MTKQSKTKILVAMPEFTKQEYLDEALESLLGQTIANQLVISLYHDGSGNEVKRDFPRTRFRRFVETFSSLNVGWARALNMAVELGLQNVPDAEYIFFIGADDKLQPDCIEKLFKTIVNKDVDWVSPYLQKFGESEDILFCEEDVTWSRLFSVNPLIYFSLITTDLWRELEGFDENLTPKFLKAGYEDWDFWMRALLRGKKYAVAKEPLYLYRIHDKQFGNEANKYHDILLNDIRVKNAR